MYYVDLTHEAALDRSSGDEQASRYMRLFTVIPPFGTLVCGYDTRGVNNALTDIKHAIALTPMSVVSSGRFDS
ncbi:hypothetical protein BURKHO8Y_10230 [Burkholderia sp. 8Y]|uniref:hypothetical protein n=1 Tax=Burkholderia sp. 8Y TaxID=2653133 RepID=UPI0012F46A22|nr:hypothetical protein [Burkholderia sp. 8Y]VXB01627.1 hypothetical protein BURKHO8Y_10230 [Burkholderia sp. 8Y]